VVQQDYVTIEIKPTDKLTDSWFNGSVWFLKHWWSYNFQLKRRKKIT